MRVSIMVQVAVTTAAAGLLAGLAAVWVASLTLEAGTAITVRCLLVVAALIVLPWWAVRRRVLSARRSVLRRSALFGLVVGYLLNPLAWVGRAVVAQAFVPVGLASFAVDLVLWVAIGMVAVLAGSSAAGVDEQTGYGVVAGTRSTPTY